MSSPEAISKGKEQQIDSKELESINHERREALRDSLENAERKHTTSQTEELQAAKNEALDQAKDADKSVGRSERSPAEKRTGLITRGRRDESFNKQMEHIQPHLSRGEQTFSKIIHKKSVEQLSDSLGSTIARPNALLAGSIAAFLLVTIVYTLAKHYGYQLSGFETIGAFVLGWILGLIYDYVRLLTNSKRK